MTSLVLILLGIASLIGCRMCLAIIPEPSNEFRNASVEDGAVQLVVGVLLLLGGAALLIAGMATA